MGAVCSNTLLATKMMASGHEKPFRCFYVKRGKKSVKWLTNIVSNASMPDGFSCTVLYQLLLIHLQ